MLSFHNIFSVALYESKNLFRSWFFRIFSLLSLSILAFINFGMVGHRSAPSMFSALPSLIPYLNILLLNVVQAVIGVFLASDFMKYDRKLDSTEVIYMRSMTNADYVLGKTLGVLVIFGFLNTAVLINAFVFNVFITGTPFLPQVYVLYPLLISLPTLIFIFGLSFMLMAIIRNQAITLIILLGYIAITIFFLGSRFHNLFDYMTFNVPLAYSDFVGFGDLTPVLIHRGIYLLAGIGFIFTTVLLLRRLPQSRIMNHISLGIAVCSITGAALLGHAYLSKLSDGKDLRQKMTVLNRKTAEAPRISINTCDLELTHDDERIDVRAHLRFTNNTPNDISRYVFSLNPGLEVKKVMHSGTESAFTRDIHIMTIEPSTALAPGAVDSLTIFYHGTINEDACYADIDEATLEENYRIILYNIQKRYSFITPRYVLLTPENIWYPVAGIPYGAAYPHLGAKDFITFTLSVKTVEGLTAVSQGAVTRGSDSTFTFEPEVPLPQLSLVIGQYEQRTVSAENIDYQLFVLEGHDFFSEYFPGIKEKLPELITDIKSDFENKIGISYPFRRLSLIEVPLQFISYPRFWTLCQETVQPEHILLREKALMIQGSDFKQSSNRMKRMIERGRNAMTPEELESNMFRRFVTTTFTNIYSPFRNIRRNIQGQGRQGNFFRSLSISFLPNYTESYSVFSHYFSHCYNFSSEKWPIFTTAIEFFLSEKLENQPSSRMRFFTGLSSEERANLELMKQNLVEILENSQNNDDVHDILKIKSAYLFASIQNAVGKEDFDFYLSDIFTYDQFKNINVEEFAREFKDLFEFDLVPLLDSWQHEKNLPAYIITDPACLEIIENERTRYQVTFTVSNTEAVDGLISANFRMRGAGGRGPGGGRMNFFMGSQGDDDEKFFNIHAGETKEIGIVLEERPSAVTVNTLISQNIPSIVENRFGEVESDENAEPFDGERILDETLLTIEPGNIIVDNEDRGFETQTVSTDSYVKRLVNRNIVEDEYIGLRFWNMPRKWKATTSSEFYGTFRRSASYIRAGKGDNKAVWNAELPNSGNYDVYYHVAEIRSPMLGRRDRDRGRQQSIQDFHFIIHHDDGDEDIELDVSSAQQGWHPLGTYYFSEGNARIELTDESKGRLVYADAVKWAIHE
ncbi:MAG: hypothetical protein HOC71_07365 [Candidatus Latescibacteria bacterium]|jgi:hypothetical protein|nr:hypothetical protein [Candidatus Latescibacterota bacterium]